MAGVHFATGGRSITSLSALLPMRFNSSLLPALALAFVAAFLMAVSGIQLTIVLAVLLVWIGSILLIGTTALEPAAGNKLSDFSADRMSDLVEHSETPVVVTRRQRILIANSSARKLLGGHIIDQDVRIALRHPKAVQLIESEDGGSALIRGLVRRQDIWQINRKLLDGGLGVFEFINRTAEADISRAHTDFVANASHELRTPLASIIGYVETLQEDVEDLDPKMAASFLNTIETEAKRLQSLVSDLMSLSRVEAEKHDQPSDIVDLSKLTERAALDAAGPRNKDRVDFESHGDFKVSGDQQQLEQLIRNLVDNAFNYGAADKPVTVRLQPQGEKRVRLSVKDRGEGIPPEHIPHLTRRFYRTDPGRSRASGGTGLGLAIVKHIVERHGGRMMIDSKLGQGTQVKVTLPLARSKK
ncbi:sensor histidine kinase [Erythrobacter sp. W53]|uniref:sensor histidine kinase n=1 Tax=Erythrobacter sp. W53 TaxID=3425947 RepID=UPI003D768F0A